MQLKISSIIFAFIVYRPIISFISTYFDILGIISLALLDLFCIIYMMKVNLKKSTWLVLSLMSLTVILSLIQLRNISVSIRDTSKFISLIILLNLCTTKYFKNELEMFIQKHSKLIKYQIWCIYMVLFMHIFDSSKYVITYGEKVFKGLFPHPHSLAYFILLMIIIVHIVYKKSESKKNRIIYNVLMLINIYILILTSARLATIIGIITILYLNNSFNFVMFSTVIGVIYIKVIGLNNISFFNKFSKASEQGSISSGRDIIWKIDLNYFFNSNIFNKLGGNGVDFPYKLHLEKYGLEIWSHNDFFNIILVYGIVGLMIYLYTIYKYIKFTDDKKVIKIIILLLIFSIGWGNGLYIYTDFIILLTLLPILNKNEKVINK